MERIEIIAGALYFYIDDVQIGYQPIDIRTGEKFESEDQAKSFVDTYFKVNKEEA